MNKNFLLLILTLIINCSSLFGQTDSLSIAYKTIDKQSEQISYLLEQVSELDSLIRTLSNKHLVLYSNLKRIEAESAQEIAIIQSNIDLNARKITSTKTELAKQLADNKQIIEQRTDSVNIKIKKKTIYGSIAAFLLLLLTTVLFTIINKSYINNKSAIDKVKKGQTSIYEELIQLDAKLITILDKQVQSNNAHMSKDLDSEHNHELAKVIANEINRIEANLAKMDKSIRGYKQLSASLNKIKDNFMANDYEIIEMLGNTYYEGMRAEVEFVIDESLKEGSRIISSIKKPQINYKGIMIQKASIIVSQNI